MITIVFYLVIFIVAIKIGNKYKSFGLIWLYSFLFTLLFNTFLFALDILPHHSELLAGQILVRMIAGVTGTLIHGLICGVIASIWRYNINKRNNRN